MRLCACTCLACILCTAELRLAELRLGEAFEKRDAPWPDLSANRVFPERFRVKALIEPRLRWRLVEEYGPECYAVQPDGGLLFEGGFADRDNAVTWLMSFEDGAELLEPEELRLAMGRIAGRLMDLYNGKGE